VASAASDNTVDRLLRSLEQSGWSVELAPSGANLTGLATLPDSDAGPLRLAAYGRDRASVVLLLFEQACARMIPDYRRSR
jgi:hypothetical protein